ncbi:MAG: glutamate--tRNA ligase [Holosporaceae bacterium]|jgi:glutamyl-tRNA synthetase|nr:glutamate--tRNA ligase [Holosporaceae bacterium]
MVAEIAQKTGINEMQAAARVRFAPSPTGLLHVGNIRIALLNYLFAKKNGGRFILRIDDTDLERSTKESENSILEDLTWLGIGWDEFFRQSANFEKYKAAAEHLRSIGRIYPCYETKEELALKKKFQISIGAPPVYDRASLNLSAAARIKSENDGIKPHWRFKLNETRSVKWNDAIHGEISIPLGAVSDPVLIKPDGSFSYTLASVVDDIDVGITCIIRGDDHITNTAVQTDIAEALGGGNIPKFAHVPLLSAADGQDVSKRHGSSLSMANLRKDGMDPRAILCVLATLGTSNNADCRDGLEELAEKFSFEKISLSSPKFDLGDVRLMTGKILSGKSFEEVKPDLEKLHLKNISEEFWNVVRENVTSLKDVALWEEILFGISNTVKQDAGFAGLMSETLKNPLNFRQWTEDLKQISGKKGRDLFHPMRILLTGREDGPELAKIVNLLGYEGVKKKIEANLRATE